MRYWLDLFTLDTWEQFQAHGGRVTGFRASQKSAHEKIQPGDRFLCYLIGAQRWIACLEVLGCSSNTDPIWKDDKFPIRFEVKPLIVLDASVGIPMAKLKSKVSFFQSQSDLGKYRGFLRKSPVEIKPADSEVIWKLLRHAQRHPEVIPIDPKTMRRPKRYPVEGVKTKSKSISSPESVTVPPDEEGVSALRRETSRHTEIQSLLAGLGAEMGLDVWIARNDRSREYKGRPLGDHNRVIRELPTQFNEATNKTIELIDVLWLKDNSIVAAFEVECSTSIYSGLLRMSDLLALQPNLTIELFIVAPDERRHKVEQEMLRPTFTLREKPIPPTCGYLPLSKLVEYVQNIRKLGFGDSLSPGFIRKIAEYF